MTEIAQQKPSDPALRRRQADAAAAQLSAIAHDFNNLLQTILGAAVLLELRADDPAGVRHLAQVVLAAGEQGGSLSRRLLAVSQGRDPSAEA